jgi:hypothetical protein
MSQILVSLAAALLLAGCATGANDGDRASGGTPADADSGAAARPGPAGPGGPHPATPC